MYIYLYIYIYIYIVCVQYVPARGIVYPDDKLAVGYQDELSKLYTSDPLAFGGSNRRPAIMISRNSIIT